MANELQYYGKLKDTGKAVIARVYNSAGAQVGADLPTTESAAAVGVFIGDMPAAPLGAYGVRFFDGVVLLGQGEIYWDGAKEAFPITLTSAEIVTAMQAVADDFKADVSALALEASVAAIPTTDNVADLAPVLTALAAIPTTDSTDKNTEAEIHGFLDTYPNKADYQGGGGGGGATAAELVTAMQVVADDFKADTTALSTQASVDLIPTTDSVADLAPVLTAIGALNDVTAIQVVTAILTVADDFKADTTGLASQASVDLIPTTDSVADLAPVLTALAAIPTTDSVADLAPVLTAITALDDVTAAQLVAAMQLVADDFKADTTALATQASVNLIPTTDSVADLTPVLTAVGQIPTNPLLTNDARLANLDAPVSGITNLTPAEVWSFATRTLSDTSGFSLSPTEYVNIATAVEQAILNDGDGQAVLNAIVGAIGNSNVDEIALVAAIRTDIERAGGLLDLTETKAEADARQLILIAEHTETQATQAIHQTETVNLVNLILKYHDNRTVFLGADNVTEVPQAQAFFMVVFDDDEATRLKTIAFRNALGQPAVITEATRYDQQ